LQNTQRRAQKMSEEERKKKCDEQNEGVLMHLETNDKEKVANFKGHLDWWTILANDLGKTLVLEARLK